MRRRVIQSDPASRMEVRCAKGQRVALLGEAMTIEELLKLHPADWKLDADGYACDGNGLRLHLGLSTDRLFQMMLDSRHTSIPLLNAYAALQAENAKLMAIGNRAVAILRAQYLTGDAREIEAELAAVEVKP